MLLPKRYLKKKDVLTEEGSSLEMSYFVLYRLGSYRLCFYVLLTALPTLGTVFGDIISAVNLNFPGQLVLEAWGFFWMNRSIVV